MWLELTDEHKIISMEYPKLYHCTKFDEGFNGILNSGYFRPSFCLEQSTYLKDKYNFAYAMVSFADLLEFETDNHMKRFSADSYICMKKKWAISNNLSPVIYYTDEALSTATFRLIVNNVMDTLQKDLAKNLPPDNNPIYLPTNILAAYFKQYKGHYYNRTTNCFSDNETLFYTEREWRHIPLVYNKEAFFLPEEDYLNSDFRNDKAKELESHGYVLRFNFDDIDTLGVPSIKHVSPLAKFLSKKYCVSSETAMAKIRIAKKCWYRSAANWCLSKLKVDIIKR